MSKKARIAKVLEQNWASKSVDETVWSDEQDDENDARPGGKNLMKMMGGSGTKRNARNENK
jgi:hypothetical protein